MIELVFNQKYREYYKCNEWRKWVPIGWKSWLAQCLLLIGWWFLTVFFVRCTSGSSMVTSRLLFDKWSVTETEEKLGDLLRSRLYKQIVLTDFYKTIFSIMMGCLNWWKRYNIICWVTIEVHTTSHKTNTKKYVILRGGGKKKDEICNVGRIC